MHWSIYLVMKYKTYTSWNVDTHFIHLCSYSLKLEFYPVEYWGLIIKYYKFKYCSSLYLPSCTISIYNNKD